MPNRNRCASRAPTCRRDSLAVRANPLAMRAARARPLRKAVAVAVAAGKAMASALMAIVRQHDGPTQMAMSRPAVRRAGGVQARPGLDRRLRASLMHSLL